MKRVLYLGLAAAAAATAISCGGDDAVKNVSPQAQNIQNVERISALSMANGGVGSGSLIATGPSEDDPSQTSLGRFVRHFGGIEGVGPALVRSNLGAGQEASQAGVQASTYSGDLQLWTQLLWNGKAFVATLYSDEGRTKNVGHATITFSTGWKEYPQSYKAEIVLTSGSLSGLHASYDCTQTSAFEGAMTYTDSYGDGSRDSGSSTWAAVGSTWQSRWSAGPGSGWVQDVGISLPDGCTYATTDSSGLTSTWLVNHDRSGTAHFEGKDSKLPADLAWTAAGNFTLTYADKSTESWASGDAWTPTLQSAAGSVGLVELPATTAEGQK